MYGTVIFEHWLQSYPRTGARGSCCSGAHNYPSDRLWLQLPAHPCVAFCPSPTQQGTPFYALLCTTQHPMMLPLLEEIHITKGDFLCPSWTAELSHTKAGLCTDFHFAFKAGTLTAGLKCQSSTLRARALRRSLDVPVGDTSTDGSSYKRRYHPAFCPLYRDDAWQLHFNQLFCLSSLLHHCERSSRTSSAMPQHVVVTQSLQLRQTLSYHLM